MALSESTTSANPMIATPEELMRALPWVRSFPVCMGPSKKAERMESVKVLVNLSKQIVQASRMLDKPAYLVFKAFLNSR